MLRAPVPRFCSVVALIIGFGFAAAVVACPRNRPAGMDSWFVFPPEVRDHTDPVWVPIDRPASEVGRWVPAVGWPVVAIHTAVLPSGKVLQYSYPSSQSSPGFSRSLLWDPMTEEFQSAEVMNDVFCSGMGFLPDGKFYLTGGNSYGCPYQGRDVTYTFDPFSESWDQLENMSVARWYPTNLSLADGSVLIMGGYDADCELTSTVEMFEPNRGLVDLGEVDRTVPLYPRLHLLSDGTAVEVGPLNQTRRFDPSINQWSTVGPMLADERFDGTSFMVPGSPDRVMTCGGSDFVTIDPDIPEYALVPTNSCEWIDFSAESPAWRSTSSMAYRRSHLNPVLLPDGTVLIVGGGQGQTYEEPVLNAELFDPATETFTLLPHQAHGRMYHSTAVLLPDARVLSAGQDHGDSGQYGEIYEPAYLHRGERPTVTSAPQEIYYNDLFSFASPQAGALLSVVLMGLPSVTHSIDITQRYVALDFVVSGETVQAATPGSGAEAPPGYYMLFAVDQDGVPSQAAFVRISIEVFLEDGFESGTLGEWLVFEAP